MQSRPVSRVLSWTVIHLGRTSPCASSDLPEPRAGRANGFLFGLAPGGVCHRRACCQPRGALLPHHFTLACDSPKRAHRRFAFCCTFRGLAPPRRYLAPCPVEPGLSSPRTKRGATARPTLRRQYSNAHSGTAQFQCQPIECIVRRTGYFPRALHRFAERHPGQQCTQYAPILP